MTINRIICRLTAADKFQEFRSKVLIINRMTPGTTDDTMSFRIKSVATNTSASSNLLQYCQCLQRLIDNSYQRHFVFFSAKEDYFLLVICNAVRLLAN